MFVESNIYEQINCTQRRKLEEINIYKTRIVCYKQGRQVFLKIKKTIAEIKKNSLAIKLRKSFKESMANHLKK